MHQTKSFSFIHFKYTAQIRNVLKTKKKKPLPFITHSNTAPKDVHTLKNLKSLMLGLETPNMGDMKRGTQMPEK